MPRISLRLLSESFYKHFPKSYIDKEKGIKPKKIFGNRFGAHDIVTYDIHPNDYAAGEQDPWALDSKMGKLRNQRKIERNKPGIRNWNYEMPKIHNSPKHQTYFLGDRVQVLVGKDSGKQGIICDINYQRNWCYVLGLNCEYETVSPDGYDAQVIMKSKKLDMATEVSLVDPSDERPAEGVWKWSESGDEIRVSARTGRLIPVPSKTLETYEYRTPSTYIETVVDTPQNLVEKVTFVAEAKSFEDSLKSEYGIDDCGKQTKPTFWY